MSIVVEDVQEGVGKFVVVWKMPHRQPMGEHAELLSPLLTRLRMEQVFRFVLRLRLLGVSR
uniref:Uncharacterized protein n=1 Tax=Rubinisphaera brasiliensis (strain ATCC 49424 / DSM 5305 / JCM 21570 / IAM 15109 / NBRC 103401 / IFAM 1448) TaxID=756272 RepID=F0SHQ3_RUBBR|nr:hypothetical protein Plabr_1924 [Rubinisphaera brasiliensis DSM 5305]